MSPAIIFFWVSGLRPMWLAIAFPTSPAATSLPMPFAGEAVSFAITTKSRFLWRTSSSITRSGVPVPMKPPIMRLAPLGIIATASFTDIVRTGAPVSARDPRQKHGPSGAVLLRCHRPRVLRPTRTLRTSETVATIRTNPGTPGRFALAPRIDPVIDASSDA